MRTSFNIRNVRPVACCLIWILCALMVVTMTAYADASFDVPGISAYSAVLLNADSGEVVYEKEAYKQRPMASTTKVLTALIAIESCAPDDIITAGKNAVGVEGTSIYLQLGEKLTVENALYGLMLASGNDVAVALAEHVSGSVEGFCKLMTRRARELGAMNTQLKNPHGLPASGHYTTAYDLALIARAALKQPLFRRIVGTTEKKIPWLGREYSRVLRNKNRLLTSFDGATGVKTGFTNAAGRCLVFSATREGVTLVGVVLNASDWFNDAEAILEYGFTQYEMRTLVNRGDLVRNIAVPGTFFQTVDLVAASDLTYTVRKGEPVSLCVELSDNLRAPIRANQYMGKIRMMSGERVLAEVPIVAENAVNINPLLAMWS